MILFKKIDKIVIMVTFQGFCPYLEFYQRMNILCAFEFRAAIEEFKFNHKAHQNR